MIFVLCGHSVRNEVIKMKENNNKSFDFAYETTKHLVALSTGIITITITFLKYSGGNKRLIIISWFLLLISIIFGQITLMAITGSMNNNSNDIFQKNIKWPAIIQFFFFLFGLLLIIIYAIVSI